MCLPYKPTYLSTTWYLKKKKKTEQNTSPCIRKIAFGYEVQKSY